MLENGNISEPQPPNFLVGSVVRRVCSECEKPKVFCKGMCQACYSKMLRNTEKGKEAMRTYNLGAGKEAQRKFRERNKANKPQKTNPLKINCECGKPSIKKNLCMNCYQRKRYRNGNCQRVYRNKLNGEVIFNNVLIYVKKGHTILNACKKIGFKSSSNLYRLITPLQKAELNAYKVLGYYDDYDDE